MRGNRRLFGILMTLLLTVFSAVSAFAQTPNPCPINNPFNWNTPRDPRCWPFSQMSPFNTSLNLNAQGQQAIVPIAPSNTAWPTYTLGFSYQANTTSVIFASKRDPIWQLWDNLFYLYPPTNCQPLSDGNPACIQTTYYNYNNSIWYQSHIPNVGQDTYPQTWCQPITSYDFSTFKGYSNYPPVPGKQDPWNYYLNPWTYSTGSYNAISNNYSPTFQMPKNYCGSPDSDGWTSIPQLPPSHLAVDLYAPIVAPTSISGDGNNYVFAKQLGNFIDLEGNGNSDTSSGTGFLNGRRASLISTIAGLIRYPELQNGFIPHALAATIGPDMLACQPSSPEAYNFTAPAFPQAWPAQGYDQQNIPSGAPCAATGGLYANAVGNIPMGALLAIPKSVALSPHMFTSCNGYTDYGCYVYVVAMAAQNYGIYIVDTGSDTYMTLLAELNYQGLPQQNPMAVGTDANNDLQIILHYLQLVTDNSPTTIGGVGTPIVQQVAPPFTY